jgi:hypothetical protein
MNLPSFLEQDSDGFVHVAGHRIGLQHLVHYYNEGFSPETLACEYPSLSLAEIHKVIAFYLLPPRRNCSSVCRLSIWNSWIWRLLTSSLGQPSRPIDFGFPKA